MVFALHRVHARAQLDSTELLANRVPLDIMDRHAVLVLQVARRVTVG